MAILATLSLFVRPNIAEWKGFCKAYPAHYALPGPTVLRVKMLPSVAVRRGKANIASDSPQPCASSGNDLENQALEGCPLEDYLRTSAARPLLASVKHAAGHRKYGLLRTSGK